MTEKVIGECMSKVIQEPMQEVAFEWLTTEQATREREQ